MAKTKIYEFTQEEENLFAKPYTEYLAQNPDASLEDFINEKYATSKGYLFAKKFNKEITPWQHFKSLSPTNRKEIFDGWNAELDQNTAQAPKEKSVAEIIAEENSQSKAPLKQESSDDATPAPLIEPKPVKKTVEEILAEKFDPSTLYGRSLGEVYRTLQKYSRNDAVLRKIEQDQVIVEQCQILLTKLALFDMAVTTSFAQNLDYVQKALLPYEAQNNISDGSYVSADRVIDLADESVVINFKEHLPEFNKDFNNPEITGDEKRASRQRLVDFVRFIESGKRSKSFLEAKDWESLQIEYKTFPKMPTSIVLKLCESQMEEAPKSDRTAMLQRVVKYNFENLIKNKNESLNEYEFKLIEDFAARAKEKDPQFGGSLSVYVETIKEQQKNLAAEKNGPIAKPIIAEKKQETPLVAEIKVEEIPLVIPQNKTEAPVIKKEISPIVSGESATPEIEHPKKEMPIKEVTKKPTIINEAEEKNSGGNEKNEPILANAGETPIQKTEESDGKWKEEIWAEWESWAKKSDKIVAKYKNDEVKDGLSLKIFANAEDQKKDLYDADITYASANNISVKGCDGLVPDLTTFEEIVKTAKKNGPEIEFGNISNPEFKAKLLLVCLNDPEIKIINQPKMSELKDIPAELKKAIEEKLPKEENKTEEKREYRKPREDRRNNEERGEPQERFPRRQYTPEETAAYEENKRLNKEKYGDERPPRRQFTAEETAAYEERKRRRDAVRR